MASDDGAFVAVTEHRRPNLPHVTEGVRESMCVRVYGLMWFGKTHPSLCVAKEEHESSDCAKRALCFNVPKTVNSISVPLCACS